MQFAKTGFSMPRPPKPDHLKVIAGTDQPCRMGGDNVVELPLVDGVPEAPSWLPNAHATKEWNRLAPVLVGAGLLTEGGLSALGNLCALHGKLVQLWAAGESPTGHLLAQYRALVNDFGLTPVAQGKVKAAPHGESKPGNKFAGVGKRA